MLRTPRLLLRRGTEADLAPFAALNADLVVMKYFPAPLTREQSDALVGRPVLDVGWRFAHRFWHQGFATEAGGASLEFGLQLQPEVVSTTAEHKAPSWRVMERLGMRRGGDFDHPRVPTGHPLVRHRLYRSP